MTAEAIGNGDGRGRGQRESTPRSLETDVLVVGAGGAGTRAAIQVAEDGLSVVLTSKGPLARSGITPLAQWSFEAAMAHEAPEDSPDQHFRDIIREGRSLSDQPLARALADEAPARVLDLERYGVGFAKSGNRFRQMATPGQTHPRSVQLRGGGHGMMLGLKREVLRHRAIDVREDLVVTDLFVDQGRVTGALGLDLRSGQLVAIHARAVILATGGHEELWPMTDTPPESIGDGFFLAYHAGASLIDLELLLFYPVVASHPPQVRGTIIPYEVTLEPKYCGGVLLNAQGERFLPEGKLPARDVMIGLIFKEIAEGRGTPRGGVYLDVSASAKRAEEIGAIMDALIPAVRRHLALLGVDIVRQPVEIAPAAHYTLGGIRIDAHGETNVPGLLAAGECAGNVQGANRSSGNALAETQVFGHRAAVRAGAIARATPPLAPAAEQVADAAAAVQRFLEPKSDPVRPHHLKARVRDVVSRDLGWGRNARGLERAIAELQELRERLVPRLTAAPPRQYNVEWLEAIEAKMMVDVAWLTARSALLREETRGHHYRTDHPAIDEARWLKHTAIERGEAGPRSSSSPISVTEIPIPVARD